MHVIYVIYAYNCEERLNEAGTNAFFVETVQEIGFHTLSLMNSTYPSTI
jgi:hypothetical protein